MPADVPAAAGSGEAPALVTVHVWGVAPRQVPAAIARMALDRRRLRRAPGVRFAKMLGTGDGRSFTARDADPLHWAALVCWDSVERAADFDAGPIAAAWSRLAHETLALQLRPLSARGRWSGRQPFGDPAPGRWDGPVAAVTRARITARKNLTFWRAVPPVSTDLHEGDGLRLALGIGEAPVALQGTLSLWDSGAALTDFAYHRRAHLEAVRRTAEERWYAEELFARFALLSAEGTYRGRSGSGGQLPA